MNEYNALFIVTVLKREQYKYSYGRAFNKNKIENIIIKLPTDKNGNPDFIYMEYYIKLLKYKPITTNIKSKRKDINVNEWKLFKMDDLFIFKKGRRLTKSDMIDGDINYLGAISENNGVRQKISVEEKDIFTSNCITVNYNGSVGEAFYQQDPFWASDDVNILYSKDWVLNKYIAMFLITIITSNKYLFSYGRKWTLEKMKETELKLPVDKAGNPDWQYMENYIKSLSYSDLI